MRSRDPQAETRSTADPLKPLWATRCDAGGAKIDAENPYFRKWQIYTRQRNDYSTVKK